MNVENNKANYTNGTDKKFDPDTEFHVALGWLTALSISIAAIATSA